MKKYDHKQIERKWQKIWEEQGIYKSSEDKSKPKFYVLNEFPYPSGDGLHVGHPKGYIAGDIYSRYMRMKGHSVLHPFGWDAFGLPAENYALKNKVHPREAVEQNIKRFRAQSDLMGFDYDWSREVNTTDPEFYRWTQWIFLQMFKKGLAYESNEPINWCPSCKTGLANEDLDRGKCERCGSAIEKKRIRQWVLAITKYADRLVDDLEELDWHESIKEQQRQWIGRSDGLLFKARVKDSKIELETFSAHYEACYADTFVVIAPDHHLLDDLIKGVQDEKKIRREIEDINVKRVQDKYAPGELEGVFTGRYLDDPLGNGHLPIWVANFAVTDYGTGIVKCSAHDPRDFAFAKKYNIPIKVVLVPSDPELRKRVENFEVCYSDIKRGILLEPLNLSGKTGAELRDLIAEYVVENGWAKRVTMYRLRDWVFSRQRYWGEPMPLVHCGKCGVVPVPEEELPVLLPEVKHYEPTGTGESPLASISEWVNVKCPKCAGAGKRETNTMPQWAGSSWYWHRYKDAHNDKMLVSKEAEKYWNMVDVYIGGAEHVTRHLIYARFWHKFLFDIGVVNTSEPFGKRVGTGLILASDGRKMSKRWNNVINPDDAIDRWGADTFRLYEMFLGPFSDTAAWNDEAIIGPRRFLEKVWRLMEKVDKSSESAETNQSALASAISKISSDIEGFAFNTAISSLMILASKLNSNEKLSLGEYETLIKLLAPFAPHVSEELWSLLGHSDSIHTSNWPSPLVSGDILSDTIITLPVQINGKVRGMVYVSLVATEDEVKQLVTTNPALAKWLGDKPISKFVYKTGKVVSVVV